MTLRKVGVSASLMAASLYILLPTPDELVIYPLGGLLFSCAFHIPLLYGVLLTMIIYRGLGAGGLVASLLVGGKPIYNMLKNKFQKIAVPC